jgi:anti-sigma-K factor RskA
MSADQHADQPGDQPIVFPSARGNASRHPDPDDLVLYAMQFLTGEEAAVLAYHLERCAECRGELARVHGDLAACALTVDLESPPETSLRLLMQQVAREKKVVPVAQAHPPIAAFGRSNSILSIESIEDRQPKRSVGRVLFAASGWAVAAALAVAVTLLYKDRRASLDALAGQTSQMERLTAEAASAHRLMDALTDPKAIRVSLTAKPQPKGTPQGGVTYNPSKGALVFLASNLDPLQMYKTYELWLIPADGSVPIPAGTFHPDDQGNASVIMPDLPKGVAAKAFGVTIEGDGGSQTPTPPIIMAGS